MYVIWKQNYDCVFSKKPLFLHPERVKTKKLLYLSMSVGDVFLSHLSLKWQPFEFLRQRHGSLFLICASLKPRPTSLLPEQRSLNWGLGVLGGEPTQGTCHQCLCPLLHLVAPSLFTLVPGGSPYFLMSLIMHLKDVFGVLIRICRCVINRRDLHNVHATMPPAVEVLGETLEEWVGLTRCVEIKARERHRGLGKQDQGTWKDRVWAGVEVELRKETRGRTAWQVF